MSNKQKYIIGAIVLVLVILLFTGNAGVRVGSVSEGSAYNSTSTLSTWSSTQRQLKTYGGVLGSVIISSSTPSLPTTATMRFMNATSTTDVSSTTIANFGYQTSAGTYTFDAAFSRGLIVETGAGFDGSYVITSR